MDTFPEELIDHICSFADMGVLCSLSRVSRQFRRIAEPHLYRTICAIFDGPFDPGYSKTDVLISTLKRRPHLRPYVKVLNAECSTEYRSSIPNQYHSLLSFRAKCDQDVHDIITLAPMMETIDMYDFVAEESLGQSWLEILPALHQHTYLKRFDIDLGSSVLTDLHHLFALPNIEIMDLRRGETNYDDEKALRHWENMKSNLRQLSIVDLRTHDQVSDVADDVKLIARSCPKLHSLESFGVVYTYGSNYFRALIRAFTIPAIKNQLSYVRNFGIHKTLLAGFIVSAQSF
ncbi:hypothetical protein K491DRAFT_149060 [Lophiostoma macrostomum CBS 122681]|uniref:F-box domain-containing protein n=1 Tax=Lophiostoma macrostomum CBS 122681 TaxID=1314788 RepID=A0A6A6SQP3_9PLEO|nr:hypothetical protein K491DRAFT_149060 [Lophiostoma macrostomum CBS 122681]